MGKVDITELYYWGDRYGLMTLIDRRTQSRKTQQGNLLVWQIICGTLRWRTLQNCLHTSLWDQSQLCRASHIPSSLIGVGAKMAKSHDSTLRYWYALVGIGFLWKGFDSCSHWPRWQQAGGRGGGWRIRGKHGNSWGGSHKIQILRLRLCSLCCSCFSSTLD